MDGKEEFRNLKSLSLKKQPYGINVDRQNGLVTMTLDPDSLPADMEKHGFALKGGSSANNASVWKAPLTEESTLFAAEYAATLEQAMPDGLFPIIDLYPENKTLEAEGWTWSRYEDGSGRLHKDLETVASYDAETQKGIVIKAAEREFETEGTFFDFTREAEEKFMKFHRPDRKHEASIERMDDERFKRLQGFLADDVEKLVDKILELKDEREDFRTEKFGEGQWTLEDFAIYWSNHLEQTGRLERMDRLLVDDANDLCAYLETKTDGDEKFANIEFEEGRTMRDFFLYWGANHLPELTAETDRRFMEKRAQKEENVKDTSPETLDERAAFKKMDDKEYKRLQNFLASDVQKLIDKILEQRDERENLRTFEFGDGEWTLEGFALYWNDVLPKLDAETHRRFMEELAQKEENVEDVSSETLDERAAFKKMDDKEYDKLRNFLASDVQKLVDKILELRDEREDLRTFEFGDGEWTLENFALHWSNILPKLDAETDRRFMEERAQKEENVEDVSSETLDERAADNAKFLDSRFLEMTTKFNIVYTSDETRKAIEETKILYGESMEKENGWSEQDFFLKSFLSAKMAQRYPEIAEKLDYAYASEVIDAMVVGNLDTQEAVKDALDAALEDYRNEEPENGALPPHRGEPAGNPLADNEAAVAEKLAESLKLSWLEFDEANFPYDKENERYIPATELLDDFYDAVRADKKNMEILSADEKKTWESLLSRLSEERSEGPLDPRLYKQTVQSAVETLSDGLVKFDDNMPSGGKPLLKPDSLEIRQYKDETYDLALKNPSSKDDGSAEMFDEAAGIMNAVLVPNSGMEIKGSTLTIKGLQPASFENAQESLYKKLREELAESLPKRSNMRELKEDAKEWKHLLDTNALYERGRLYKDHLRKVVDMAEREIESRETKKEMAEVYSTKEELAKANRISEFDGSKVYGFHVSESHYGGNEGYFVSQVAADRHANTLNSIGDATHYEVLAVFCDDPELKRLADDAATKKQNEVLDSFKQRLKSEVSGGNGADIMKKTAKIMEGMSSDDKKSLSEALKRRGAVDPVSTVKTLSSLLDDGRKQTRKPVSKDRDGIGM